MDMDGYIRVSQVRGRTGESFISPDVQRKQIERWAELRDATIVEWHVDLDQSGAKESRPGLVRALERIESGQTEGIVVAKLDRFARSLTTALECIRRIDAAGAKFVSVAEGIDPTTAAGKLQQNIMLVFAEFELDRIRDNWRVARGRAVARGVHISSKTPTGYLRDETGRLVPNPEYAPVIAELFERRASGDGWLKLSDFLRANGIVSPYESKNWTAGAVSKIIHNRVYLGEARHGEFINPDGHEPLVTRAMWESAQGVRTVHAARSKGRGALLAGVLRCAGCRYAMKPDTMKEARTGEQIRIYRCRGRHASGDCPSRGAVLGRVVEPFVEAAFLDAVVGMTAYGSWAALDAANAELADAEAELRAYRDDERIVSTLGRDMFVEGLQRRMDAVDEAARAVGKVYREAATRETTSHFDLAEMWPGLEVDEKQKLLMGMFDAIMLRSGRGLPIEDRVSFVAAGAGDDDMPKRGRRGPIKSFVWPGDRPRDVGVPAEEDP